MSIFFYSWLLQPHEQLLLPTTGSRPFGRFGRNPTGALDSGGQATPQSYGDIEFKDPTFVHYRRDPILIQSANSGKRIAESGRWEGVWQKSDGVMRKTGVYLARWVPAGASWRLKSELFVTLSCTGSVSCQGAD